MQSKLGSGRGWCYRMMYKVFVDVPAGEDDTLKGEYTGNRYATYDEAKPELLEAREDPGVCFAWIEEVE